MWAGDPSTLGKPPCCAGLAAALEYASATTDASKAAALNHVQTPAAPAPPPELLAEITADLAAGEDLRALLDRFLGPIVRLAGARAGAVRMLSADGEHFELVSTLGLPESLARSEHLVDRHCGFCGQGIDEVRVVWTRKLAGCAEKTGDAFFGHACHCAMAVPLQHHDRVLGIYNLFFEEHSRPSARVLALLRSVGEGWCWSKLSGAHRISREAPDYPDAQPFHEALVRANPERLVWGGDWPHPRIEGEMPDAGHLFELFQRWTPDMATQRRILVTNPAKLYGFPT